MRRNTIFLQGAAVHRLVSQASQNMSDCLLCFSSIEKLGDSSRKAVEHFFKNVYTEILSFLSFTWHPTSYRSTSCHICKKRLRKLQKRRRPCQELDTGIIHDCSCINEFH